MRESFAAHPTPMFWLPTHCELPLLFAEDVQLLRTAGHTAPPQRKGVIAASRPLLNFDSRTIPNPSWNKRIWAPNSALVLLGGHYHLNKFSTLLTARSDKVRFLLCIEASCIGATENARALRTRLDLLRPIHSSRLSTVQ